MGLSTTMATPDAYLEGSPFDRLIFLSLIVAGVLVLARRRASWQSIIAGNKWVFLCFVYLGISALWSDYPFVAFKRWIKDVGNVVMVLVILSEDEPIEAVKTVLLRCSYLVVFLSVLFIKYFPDIGRYYNPWTWTYHYGGVTSDKNMLGMSLFVCALFLFWNLLELRKEASTNRMQILSHFGLIVAVLWLFHMANSSTAQSCTVLGAGLLIATRKAAIREKFNQFALFLLGGVVLLLLLDGFFNLREKAAAALGRDSTLTGRMEIWQIVLNEKTNPWIGVGFYSFWLGDRPERLSEQYWFHLNESHSGYLETYLNSGLFGLFLLGLVLAYGFKRVKERLLLQEQFGDLRLAFLVGVLVYNITEAAFSRLSPVWFALLLVILEYPPLEPALAANEAEIWAESTHEAQA
jgi:O-antigen ligase